MATSLIENNTLTNVNVSGMNNIYLFFILIFWFILYSTYTDNWIGVEGGKAMATALKENNTITTLNLASINSIFLYNIHYLIHFIFHTHRQWYWCRR